MSPPETDRLLPLVRRDDEPVFDEPWQAQALGLAFSLVERGVFSPEQWSKELGAAHRRILAAGAADTPATYYEAVVHAVEQLMRENGPISVESLEERVSAWRRAYIKTPHGQPVHLAVGREPGGS